MLAFFGCISSHFRRIIFQIFPGEYAPGPPYLAHACAVALAPPLEDPLRGPWGVHLPSIYLEPKGRFLNDPGVVICFGVFSNIHFASLSLAFRKYTLVSSFVVK